MPKDLTEKKEKTWTALTVMNDVKARLDRIREKRQKELGVELSWSKFLSLVMDDLEKHAGNGKK